MNFKFGLSFKNSVFGFLGYLPGVGAGFSETTILKFKQCICYSVPRFRGSTWIAGPSSSMD